MHLTYRTRKYAQTAAPQQVAGAAVFRWRGKRVSPLHGLRVHPTHASRSGSSSSATMAMRGTATCDGAETGVETGVETKRSGSGKLITVCCWRSAARWAHHARYPGSLSILK